MSAVTKGLTRLLWTQRGVEIITLLSMIPQCHLTQTEK